MCKISKGMYFFKTLYIAISKVQKHYLLDLLMDAGGHFTLYVIVAFVFLYQASPLFLTDNSVRNILYIRAALLSRIGGVLRL